VPVLLFAWSFSTSVSNGGDGDGVPTVERTLGLRDAAVVASAVQLTVALLCAGTVAVPLVEGAALTLAVRCAVLVPVALVDADGDTPAVLLTVLAGLTDALGVPLDVLDALGALLLLPVGVVEAVPETLDVAEAVQVPL